MAKFDESVAAIAQRANAKINKRSGLQGTFLDTLVQLVSTFLPMIMTMCNKTASPKAIAQRARKPGLLVKANVHSQVMKALRDDESIEFRNLRPYARDISEAVLDEAAAAKEEAVEEVVNEVLENWVS